jgi:isopentenyl diphosphate isomerase/L-lactate dehydrogenase-like FMN-dependent dehydrogenase
MGSYSIEDIAAVSDYPFWFQLYLWRDRDLVASLVQRAAQAGCGALVVTVDVPLNGKRERDLRNGFTLPPRITAAGALNALRKPRWVLSQLRAEPITFKNFFDAASSRAAITEMGAYSAYINAELANPAADYEDLAWIRELWPRTLIVKGIMTGSDAVRAVECGADGILVSNHGGRQLDGVAATVDALPEVVASVGDRVDVFLDGGIRRGTDVVKALALGAKACFIGRPWSYALSAGGQQGVEAVLDMLHDEIDQTLALIGRATIGELDHSCLNAAPRPMDTVSEPKLGVAPQG